MALEVWRWECEDDEEALGMQTLCARRGITVAALDRDGKLRLEATDDDAVAARELQEQILGHHVREVDEDRRLQLDRRERWTGITLAGGIFGILFLIVLFWG